MKATLILIGLLFTLSPGKISANGELLAAKQNNAPQHIATDTTWQTGLRIRPFHLEIVPPSSGVQFYRDGIMFLSYSRVEGKIPDRHISFGSVRTYTSVVVDTLPGQFVGFNLEKPALFPSEATTFASDYNTMYLSLIPEESTKEKIFRAEHTQAGWKIEANPLDICSGNYIYSHPCLSTDGTFMIFSSDMPGTTGGLDLFITRKKNNLWSKPENLGKAINSSGNELFASLDINNNLYFSSDGLPGQGGYDVFLSRYNGSEWETPQDLTGTLNTKDDELAFTINRADYNTAFYTSRARGGRYRTQLFIVDINPGMEAKSNINMVDLLLANVSTVEKVPGTEKTDEEMMIASSTVSKETAGKNSDTVQTKIVTQIPETKKESDAPVRQVQSSTSSEAKKEVPQDNNQVQPAQTQVVKKDEIVYRVQILANTKAVGSQNITVAGKIYKSFEYLYMGGYRTTIGEYNTLSEAARLQAICRQNGYSQAFVVAFKNNIRSTDPELFK